MLGSSSLGFRKINDIVKSMNGLLKSTAFSRWAVIVREPVAISAF
jgi:hypothetical protein